ncbi:MAG: Gldg family protein [Limisphaerales bacterium]
MKNKSLETYLYSVIGVGAMFLLLVGLNVVVGALKTRLDLTEEKAHTLSDGTRAILRNLESEVTVRFYCTQVEDATAESVFLLNYARQVEDVLDAVKRASGGKVKVVKFDPQPDSDAEDSARVDGIEGQPLPPYGESFYLGLSVSRLDERVAIPFLSPSRERLVEYDLARAISGVTRTEKPVVGVMSVLPVQGMPANPMMAQMGQMPRGQDPWIIISELKRDFEVREVPMTAETIDEDIQLLVVIHPRDITDGTQYAIDQFVLRGGKLLAFVDPLSFADNQQTQGMNPMQQAMNSGSSMETLFKAWGVQFDVSKCVSDMTYKATLARNGRPEEAPAVLMLDKTALNQDDPVTGELDNMLMPYAGVFTGTPAEGLTQTVLIKTSGNSMLVDKIMAQFGGGVDKDFKPGGTEQTLALRLNGKFKTAFPDGKPGAVAGATEGEDKPAVESGLKEGTTETSVVLVGDSDMLFDPVAAQVQSLFGQRIIIPQNGNLSFGQSMVELLAGDSNLIAVRSRASLNRPFTVVKQLEAQAQDRYRSRIRDLEADLQETQNKLSSLQSTKTDGQRFILSPEQQQELENFRTKEADARKELKMVRRNLRQDVDALENRMKWYNIALMPLLVTISGIGIAVIKRKKTAAQ